MSHNLQSLFFWEKHEMKKWVRVSFFLLLALYMSTYFILSKQKSSSSKLIVKSLMINVSKNFNIACLAWLQFISFHFKQEEEEKEEESQSIARQWNLVYLVLLDLWGKKWPLIFCCTSKSFLCSPLIYLFWPIMFIIFMFILLLWIYEFPKK